MTPESFPRVLRLEAIERVRVALQEVITPPISDLDAIDRAESFVKIGEDAGVAFEALLQWIYYKMPGKLWSLDEWRRWVEKYTSTLKEIAAVHSIESPGQRCGHCGAIVPHGEALSHKCRLICTHCQACEMQRQNGVWMCGNCGEVVI